MADKGNHNEIAKMTPTELKGEVHRDMSEYFKAEKGHDAGGTATSGERLKDAAVAFEHTLKQDDHVKQLADAIKNGTPGTPEWDKLMKSVQDQMEGNNKQIAKVQGGMTDCSTKLVAANNEVTGGRHLAPLTISGHTG